jgi:hypothetical protein
MVRTVNPGTAETLAGVVAQQVTQATSVNLNCSAFDVLIVSNVKLVAIKVGTMTTTTG